jgi:alpha-N-arabinofuranosidase
MSRHLSSEVASGFTGVYLGVYATGHGKPSTASADFDWFEYRPL